MENKSGVQVAVYGTRGPPGNYTTKSAYSVDGGPPTMFTAPDELDAPEYKVQFYISERLSSSQHTLVLTNYGNWYYLDYIQVTVPDEISSSSPPPSSAPSSPSSQMSSPQTSSPAPTPSGSDTPLVSSSPAITPKDPTSAPQLISSGSASILDSSMTQFSLSSGPDGTQASSSRFPVSTIDAQPSFNQLNSHSTSLSTGAIVGITFACLGLVVALLALFLFCKKQRASRGVDKFAALSIMGSPIGTFPFP